MSIFNKKKPKAEPTTAADEGKSCAKPFTLPVMLEYRYGDLRPCVIEGRRALFHRWINSAHPVPPRGAEINEKTRYFQFRRTEGLVEYEDGTIDRVFPTAIKFLDGGAFDSFDWSGAEGVDDK